MNAKQWFVDLVDKLTGCKSDIKALQEQVSALAVAKDDVSGLSLKLDNAIGELKKLAEFTVGLNSKVDALAAAPKPVPTPAPDLPADVLQQIKDINDALANLPELPA